MQKKSEKTFVPLKSATDAHRLGGRSVGSTVEATEPENCDQWFKDLSARASEEGESTPSDEAYINEYLVKFINSPFLPESSAKLLENSFLQKSGSK